MLHISVICSGQFQPYAQDSCSSSTFFFFFSGRPRPRRSHVMFIQTIAPDFFPGLRQPVLSLCPRPKPPPQQPSHVVTGPLQETPDGPPSLRRGEGGKRVRGKRFRNSNTEFESTYASLWREFADRLPPAPPNALVNKYSSKPTQR